MTGFIVDALRSIPSEVRKWMMLGIAAAVVAVQIAQILELDWDFAKIWQIVGLVGGYLGIQGVANLNPAPVELGDEPDGGETLVDPDEPVVDPTTFPQDH